ncbi:hypothetical protein, partial [Treponema saccharophilum]|uniref:hypothetical protein n=1 Tax=Treponema saccharophilum TaxID=165 RepID=UPI001C26839A
HGAAERSSSAVEQPLQPAGKQIAKRMRVHHQKNPQNKKTTSQNSIHATNPTTEPRMHRILGGRTAAPPRRKTSRATNAGSPPKNPQTKKTTSQKSNPRAKSHHGAADAPHPRRPNSRSNPQENKSRNECRFITKKYRKQKKQPPQNSIHAQNPHHGAADAPHPRRTTAAPTRRKT